MNKRFYLPLNLQFFAESTETEVEDDDTGADFEIDDSEADDSEDTETDDGVEIEEEETPEDDEPEEPEAKEPPERNKTADAVIAERKKWQAKLEAANKKAALAEKMMQHAGVSDLETFQKQLDALEAQKHIDQGVDPAYAQMLVTQQRQLAEMQRTLNRQKYDVQVTQLKSNPFFADIDDVREEVEEFADRSGLTLEQAYMAVRGPQRMKDFETQVTQRVLNNQQKKQSKKLDTSNSGQPKTQPKVKLSADELAVAKAADMTAEEYYKYKKK